jgi:endonuclease/exonuclease/phosphatase (EEP) superfamily protein YafD
MIRSVAVVFNWKSVAQPEISFWGLAAAAGTVALLCTFAGFAARLGWLFELTSHFRLQYTLFLLTLGVAFALRKRVLPASLFLAGALINFLSIAPYLPGTRSAEPVDAQQLRLLLINVHSANQDSARVLGLIEQTQPDLVLLEEITPQWMDRLAGLQTHYPHAVCEPREDNFGIALFSRVALTRAQIVYFGEAEVPSVEAEFSLSGKGVLFLGTHPVPPASPLDLHLRNDQLRAVAKRLGACTGPALLLGDLNTTPYSPHFGDLIQDSRLRDTARGFLLQGTWPAAFPPLRIPLDHCLASPEFLVSDRHVGPRIGSDHLPLHLVLSLPKSDGP